nr:phospholipid carrier-dependent glycosyltransferase [Azospirillum argentinense]
MSSLDRGATSRQTAPQTAMAKGSVGVPGAGMLDRWPWWGLCAGLAAVMVASAVAIGFRTPYWSHADQDLVLAYHGLLFNEGLPQEYFDHPGYTYFLVIEVWYRLLHGLGLMPVVTLSGLPPAADTAAYNAAWQNLVEAGRALSILITTAFALVYANLVRALVGDRRVAFLAAVVMAFGIGLSTQARQMRTDLLSASFVVTALLLVLVAIRTAPGWRPLLLLGLAGLLAGLAMVTKIQAIFLALGIPVIALAFGRRFPGEGGQHWIAAGVLGLAAAAAALPAVALIQHGIASAGQSLYPYRPVGGGLSGVYQGIIVGWVVLGMAVYAAVWRVRLSYAVAAMAAVALGLALGVLTLTIRPHEQNVIAVANLIEHMFVFTTWKHQAALQGQEQVLSDGLVTLLAKGLWRTLAIRTIVFHPDNIPQTVVVEWFIIGGCIVLWRRGERVAAAQAALLLLVAWGLETLFSLRGFQRAYAAYTDPLMGLAAAWVLLRLPGLLERARTRRWIVGTVALVVVVAQVWPTIEAIRLPNPAGQCGWIPTYMKHVEPFPFCRPG